MSPASFARAVFPALAVEVGLFVVTWLLSESNNVLLTLLWLVSAIALPFGAGFRVARSGGRLMHAWLGGVTISLATLLCAAMGQLVMSPDWGAFEGFVLATLVFSVPLQAMFGFLGGWLSLHGVHHGA